MKKISLRSKGDEYHYDLALAIGKAAKMTPKSVVKAGIELLYQQLKEGNRGKNERGITDEG